jgi:predicted HicB family RNase H-like nuclease
MSRVKGGNRRLMCDISKELHKGLCFLAIEHDTSIMKYVKLILEEHVKKNKKGTPLARKEPHVKN